MRRRDAMAALASQAKRFEDGLSWPSGRCPMSQISRRDLLMGAASVGAAMGGRPAAAAMGPNDKFDLLVKGGERLDPSQSLRAKRDIGIRYGVVEAVEGNIPADRALRVLDASGKLVTPGLVDLHTHVYPY